MPVNYKNSQSMRIGVIMRRQPGVTRWAKWIWKAVGVLPGAGPLHWKELRSEAGVTDYHAATENVWLYVSDTEAYVHELAAEAPSLYVILRQNDRPDALSPLDIVQVTASPYEAQDYADSGEEIVEKIEMPSPVRAWVEHFVETYHVEETFVKRRRDKTRLDMKDDGVGDARISQASDVYRAPSKKIREAAE